MELANVRAAIFPSELAFTLFHAANVITLVLGFVWPYFDSFTVLLVILPATLVPVTISVRVDSEPVRLVVPPFSFIDTSLHLDQSTMTTCNIFYPPTIVSRPIWPNLYSSSFSLIGIFIPLSLINNSISHLCQSPQLTKLIIDNIIRTKRPINFFSKINLLLLFINI